LVHHARVGPATFGGMRLAHVGLTVTDQRRSRRFYETHFGFDARPARSYPDATLIIQDADGFALALHPGTR
jgi:hypothetical protein